MATSALDACAELLKRELGVAAAFLTTSCTAAMEAAALILELEPSSEVILPSFTHPGTANAFALRGARLVFVDIRPDSCNLDVQAAVRAMGPRTRAVVPVHYAGVGCEMETLLRACRERGLHLVEDAAHALFSRHHGVPLGSIGELAAVSFHHTKNLSCHKGGALLVRDPELVARAEQTVDSGTDRLAFLRGEVERYSWQRLGVNALLAEPLAELLLPQLEAYRETLERRRRLWLRYRDELGEWARRSSVRLPEPAPAAEANAHIFHLRLPSPSERQRFVAHMGAHGVEVKTHYVPLHLSSVGRSLGYGPGDLPVTEEAAATLVRLPLGNQLRDDEQSGVIHAVTAFR